MLCTAAINTSNTIRSTTASSHGTHCLKICVPLLSSEDVRHNISVVAYSDSGFVKIPPRFCLFFIVVADHISSVAVVYLDIFAVGLQEPYHLHNMYILGLKMLNKYAHRNHKIICRLFTT